MTSISPVTPSAPSSSAADTKALAQAQAQLNADEAGKAKQDVIKADQAAVDAAQRAVDDAKPAVSVTGSFVDTSA